MKRVVVILIVLLAVCVGVLYVGVSSVQSFSYSTKVGCTATGAIRILGYPFQKLKAWPGEKTNDSTFRFNEMSFTTGNGLLNEFPLTFSVNNFKTKGSLVVEEINADTARFFITAITTLSYNPIKRIEEYLNLQELKKNIDALLSALKKRFIDETIIYGISIEKTNVKDSTMIAVKKTMNHYPSVEEIYQAVDDIKEYIHKNGGKETSAPMLNIFKESETAYFTMIAVPTMGNVRPSEFFLLKQMLPGGFILSAQVTGGMKNITAGEEAIKQYVIDHRKTSPAIPFQLLVTDRRKETDTTKWVTRLYYPILY